MMKTLKLLGAALMASALGLAAAPASAMDLWSMNAAFDAQFNQFVANGMNDLMAQCAQARAMGYNGHGCFDGYNPQIWSDANTGGAAITGGYWDRQAVTGQAMNDWSNAILGQQAYGDNYGNVYYGNPYGTSNWVDVYGNLHQMNGYTPPDYVNQYAPVYALPGW